MGFETIINKLDELLNAKYILAHINPKTPGVVIPEHLSEQELVTLQLSRFFRTPLSMEDDKIVCELLFNGEYFKCEIPYASILAVTSEDSERTNLEETKTKRPQLKRVK